jgi:hypothetical protein
MRKSAIKITPVIAPMIQLMSWNRRYVRSPRMLSAATSTTKTVPNQNQVVGLLAHVPIDVIVSFPVIEP